MKEKRTCISCGTVFTVTEKDLEEARQELMLPGRHPAADCPEGLDTLCPGCIEGDGLDECKSCRPKSDGMRA